MRVAVVRTGTANLASVLAALARAGAEPTLTHDPDAVRAADRAVLPGVGAFGAAMAELDRPEPGAPRGALAQAIAERVRDGRPLLGVCLGLQLLCRASEESPGVAGIGAVDAEVRRFRGDVLVPQLGWNHIEPAPDARLLRAGYVYYANSYRLDALPAGWSGALSDHGGPFVAALERGPVLACQFHPELSGRFGHELLARWLSA